jgi:hypothetical protein
MWEKKVCVVSKDENENSVQFCKARGKTFAWSVGFVLYERQSLTTEDFKDFIDAIDLFLLYL